MKRIFSVVICFMIMISLFSGCNLAEEAPYVPTGDGLTYEDQSPDQDVDSNQSLMLTYYPAQTLNPLICTDYTNRILFSLMFQSLFTVDRDYKVEPQLVKNYHMSTDMKTYTFYLEPATFSDGSVLTAQDVVATLEKARESTYYKGRFLHISEISATEDGAVKITTDTSMENLPLLLDIPILRADQLELSYPLGTGPYQLDTTGLDSRLRRRSDWWCSAKMVVTAGSITLIEAESVKQIRDNFHFGGLDVVMADQNSGDYRCDFELWSVENGIFLFLACSEDSRVFSNDKIRIALTHAIDRDTLALANYRSFARAATLPAVPGSPYYNQGLAKQYGYDPVKFAEVLSDQGYVGAEITLLVNSGDTVRVQVAKSIAAMLTDCGLKVTLSQKSGSNYQYAVRSRQYDLYLGQTMLSPNMDLSAFFSTYGALSWGGVNDVTAYALCMEALANQGNYYSLHKNIMENGLLCPVLFRSYGVYATRGLVTGLTPTRDNIFYYSMGKTMEEALIRE